MKQKPKKRPASRRRKPDPSPPAIKWAKLAIGAVAFLVSLLGGLWTLDRHWTPREIHEIALAQQGQINEGFLKRLETQGLQQDANYWRRRVEDLKRDCAANPKNKQLQADLVDAIAEHKKAEDRLYEAQKVRK